MVEVYDNRVEITSPGGVCKGITLDNFGKVSITRNSIIASMLYRIDYIEQMGTGILRMKNATKGAKVAEPVFDLFDFFRVTFFRNQSVSNNGASIISDRPAIEYSDRYSLILKYLAENGKGKNADFSKLLGLSSRRVREILQDMIRAGLVKKHGDRRYAYYTAMEHPS